MPDKHTIEFVPSSIPITEPVTKFGGQPVWIDAPQWPVSRSTGNPMRFICQIDLTSLFPTACSKVAYLFMTDEEDGDYVDGTWEPDGGENAVILQPGETKFPIKPLSAGPTLYEMVEQEGFDRRQRRPVEFSVELTAEIDDGTGGPGETKLRGVPVFLQDEEFPFDRASQLLLQVDASAVPFEVNFGDGGVGYLFLNENADQGKFLWQC